MIFYNSEGRFLMNSKRKSQYELLIFIVITLIIVNVYNIDSKYSDNKVLISNSLILLLSLIFMFLGDKYNYSLNKIFMTFSFFFFGIAPRFQYQSGIVFWKGSFFSDDSYYLLNIIIILILIAYQILYFKFSNINNSRIAKLSKRLFLGYNQVYINRLLFLSIISLLITLHYNSYNLENLLYRGGGNVNRISVSQPLQLIYNNFIRPIPVISLIFFKKEEFKNKKVEFLLIVIVLISNFPTSRARFYIAAIYIPLLLTYIKYFKNKYMLLNKIIMIGLLFIFPLLDKFRNINNIKDLNFSLNFKMFIQAHFDSYQMFMRVVDNNIITWGKQLLSPLLFFVPRTIWETKPLGSGYYISDMFNLSFDNISMNFFGEGYINFGYLGIFIFIIIIAFINALLDRIYWNNNKEFRAISVFYMFFLGLEFFILRGDLLSSFSFTIGIFVSVFFVYIISGKKIV